MLIVQSTAGERGRLLLVDIRDPDVELEVDQLHPQLVQPEKAHVHLHAGMPLQEKAVDVRQYRGTRRHGSQPNASGERLLKHRELLQHGVAVRQNSLGPLYDPTSFRREALKALVTQNDWRTELRFQLLDGVRKARLRNVAMPSRPAEMPLLGERHQVFQLTQEHSAPRQVSTNAQ